MTLENLKPWPLHADAYAMGPSDPITKCSSGETVYMHTFDERSSPAADGR